jgi:hypothetical protein
VLTCQFATLAHGTAATVDVVVTVTSSGSIDNYVSVYSDQYDPNTADNFADLLLAAADTSGTTPGDPGNGSQPGSGSGNGNGGGAQVSLPAPTAGKSVNLAPTKGIVLIQPPGTRSFQELNEAQQLPVGTTVDATNGTVRVTSSGGAGTFYGGQFKVTEPSATPASRGTSDTTPTGARVTQLQLAGGNFSHCATSAKAPKHGKKVTLPATTVVRQLWGRGVGSFRTAGRYSTTATKSAFWLTADLCAGTLTRVKGGTAQVADSVHKRKVALKAGGSYLATPAKQAKSP